MTQDQLAALIKRPELQRLILDDYEGAYALGLTLNPDNREELAIRVRIEGQDAARIPAQIVWGGERIPVVVQTNFRAPEPLARHA